MSAAALRAAERELRVLKEMARTPRKVQIGCSIIAHERMGFCAVCTRESILELNGWRLLALIENNK